MAGIKNYKTHQQIDGKSFVPILKNANYTDNQRALYWHFPNKWIPEDGPGINYKSAIRQGDWKLIYNMRDGSTELYNLKEDIGEQKNQVAAYPEKAKALAAKLGTQFKEWEAPMPVVKATGKRVAVPGLTGN